MVDVPNLFLVKFSQRTWKDEDTTAIKTSIRQSITSMTKADHVIRRIKIKDPDISSSQEPRICRCSSLKPIEILNSSFLD